MCNRVKRRQKARARKASSSVRDEGQGKVKGEMIRPTGGLGWPGVKTEKGERGHFQMKSLDRLYTKGQKREGGRENFEGGNDGNDAAGERVHGPGRGMVGPQRGGSPF